MEPSFFSLYVLPWLIKITLAAGIAFGGYYLSKWAMPMFERLLRRANLDAMLIGFFLSVGRTLFLLFIAIAALSQLGLNTTSLVALVGAAGIAVGLALKDSLANFAAGVMILSFKPFNAGDFIATAGVMGTVDQIGIFHTRMHTPDNLEMVVPNSTLYHSQITNYSVRKTRRLELTVGIDYADDIGKAKTAIAEMLAADERVLTEPAPMVLVGALADSSVNLIVRPWINTSDMPQIQSDLQQQIKQVLDGAGITIPFPQLVINQPTTGDGEGKAA